MEDSAHLGHPIDPRVRRTRLMLFEALQALLNEKDFENISVQDIARKAMLNRATFYDHYPDKVALLEAMVHERFMRLIAKHGLRFDVCDGAIRRIALIVCDFISDLGCDGTRQRRQLELQVQMAVIATLRQIIVEGSQRYRETHKTLIDDRALELIATAAAWAICGATHAWARTPDRSSDDEAAVAIEIIVAPMFSALLGPVARNVSTTA